MWTVTVGGPDPVPLPPTPLTAHPRARALSSIFPSHFSRHLLFAFGISFSISLCPTLARCTPTLRLHQHTCPPGRAAPPERPRHPVCVRRRCECGHVGVACTSRRGEPHAGLRWTEPPAAERPRGHQRSGGAVGPGRRGRTGAPRVRAPTGVPAAAGRRARGTSTDAAGEEGVVPFPHSPREHAHTHTHTHAHTHAHQSRCVSRPCLTLLCRPSRAALW